MGNETSPSCDSDPISMKSVESINERRFEVEKVTRKVKNVSTISVDDVFSYSFISQKHQRLVTFHPRPGHDHRNMLMIWDISRRSKQEKPLTKLVDVDQILEWNEDFFLMCFLKSSISKVGFLSGTNQVKLTRIFSPTESEDVNELTCMKKLSPDVIGAPDTTGKIHLISINERGIQKSIDTGLSFASKMLRSEGFENCIFHEYEHGVRLFNYEKEETVIDKLSPCHDYKNVQEKKDRIDLIYSFVTFGNDEVLVLGGIACGLRFFNTSHFMDTETNDFSVKYYLKTDFFSPCLHIMRLSHRYVLIGLSFQPSSPSSTYEKKERNDLYVIPVEDGEGEGMKGTISKEPEHNVKEVKILDLQIIELNKLEKERSNLHYFVPILPDTIEDQVDDFSFMVSSKMLMCFCGGEDKNLYTFKLFEFDYDEKVIM